MENMLIGEDLDLLVSKNGHIYPYLLLHIHLSPVIYDMYFLIFTLALNVYRNKTHIQI